MKVAVHLFIFIILLGVGCVRAPSNMQEHIILNTSDNIEISGIYRNTNQNKIAVLLHMMPATKESWDKTADYLSSIGYASIAIDERGHGESTMKGTLNYKSFTDEQQQAKRLDVEATIAFAKSKGFEERDMIIVGASIGANLAIQALTEYSSIPLAIVLSPGLDFHGLLTEPLIKRLADGQKVILVASEDDKYSFESIRALHEYNPFQTVLVERRNIGHGTDMIDKDAGLLEQFFPTK